MAEHNCTLGELVVVGRVGDWHAARAPWADVASEVATPGQAAARVQEALDVRHRAGPVPGGPDPQVVVHVEASIRPATDADISRASGPEAQQALACLGYVVRGRTRFHVTLADPATGRSVVLPLAVEPAAPTMVDVLRRAAALADELASVL